SDGTSHVTTVVCSARVAIWLAEAQSCISTIAQRRRSLRPHSLLSSGSRPPRRHHNNLERVRFLPRRVPPQPADAAWRQSRGSGSFSSGGFAATENLRSRKSLH